MFLQRFQDNIFSRLIDFYFIIRQRNPDAEERFVKNLIDPKMPSEEEAKMHDFQGHIPYRNWCTICVTSMGKDDSHVSCPTEERKVPEYHFDYCFPGDELGFKWTVLVGKERLSGAVMATAVPMKGISQGKFVTDRCLDFIEENGDRENDVIVKSDQENAIEILVRDIVEDRPEGKTLVEEAPTMQSKSNGLVERAVQEIEGRV